MKESVSGSLDGRLCPPILSLGNLDLASWPVLMADSRIRIVISERILGMRVLWRILIDLCGDAMPEKVWGASGCPTPCVGGHKCVGGWTKTNCTDFVARNPEAFAEAYWEFGEFRVYKAV